MKNRKLILKVLAALIGMISMVMNVTAEEEAAYFEENVTSLTERLALTGEQVARLTAIFDLAASQAKVDRETYSGSALALIRAAERRRNICDGHIEALVNDRQLQEYGEIKTERRSNEELFELKEGLLLNETQTRQVENILAEFKKKYGKSVPNKKRGSRPGSGMRGGGMKGGGMGGGGRGGGKGGGMRGGGDMGGQKISIGRSNPMMDMWKEREAKKAKQIKKVLTKDQKELYKEVRKYNKKQMEKKFKAMQEK